MYSAFTNSDGWNEYPPNSSQLRAPNTASLVTTFSPSSASANTATGMRASDVRRRFLSHQPSIRKSTTPAAVSRSCLYISSGVDDAATDIPSELR